MNKWLENIGGVIGFELMAFVAGVVAMILLVGMSKLWLPQHLFEYLVPIVGVLLAIRQLGSPIAAWLKMNPTE